MRGEFTITDAALVPDELCDVTVTMSALIWPALLGLAHEVAAISMHDDRALKADLEAIKVGPRTPSNERIRAALQQPCPECNGSGMVPQVGEEIICPECDGTKTASVPGARLEAHE